MRLLLSPLRDTRSQFVSFFVQLSPRLDSKTVLAQTVNRSPQQQQQQAVFRKRWLSLSKSHENSFMWSRGPEPQRVDRPRVAGAAQRRRQRRLREWLRHERMTVAVAHASDMTDHEFSFSGEECLWESLFSKIFTENLFCAELSTQQGVPF